MVLLAVDEPLEGVEGISGSCDAEEEEASPTEGEMWKVEVKKVDSASGILNQATTGGWRNEVKLVCWRSFQDDG